MCLILTHRITALHRANTTAKENDMQTNQIVKGKVAGFFVILGEREIAGEKMYQVKPYNPETGKAGRGEMCLPAEALIEI